MKPKTEIVRKMVEFLKEDTNVWEKMYNRFLRVTKGKSELPAEWETALLIVTEANNFDELRKMYPRIVFRKGLFSAKDAFEVKLLVANPESLVQSTDFLELYKALEVLKKLGFKIELKVAVPD